MVQTTSTSPQVPSTFFTAVSSQLAWTPPWFSKSTPGRNVYGILSPEDALDSTDASAHANFSGGMEPSVPGNSAACAWLTNADLRSTRACVGVPRSDAICVGVQSAGTDGDAFPARPGSVAKYAPLLEPGSPSSKRICSASVACVASSGAPIAFDTFTTWSTNCGTFAVAFAIACSAERGA